MEDRWEFKNLGRQSLPVSTWGMWPGGEYASVRDAYDEMLRRADDGAMTAADILGSAALHVADTMIRIDDGTTKVCYNCGGSGKVGNKMCSRCGGSGSLPAAG